jgi:hypothetical protein
MLPAFNSDTFSTKTNTKTHLVMKPKTTKPPTRITKQSTMIFRPSVFGLAFVAVLESAWVVGIAADDATTTSNEFVRYLQSQNGNFIALSKSEKFFSVPNGSARSVTESCPVEEILLSHDCIVGGGYKTDRSFIHD